MRYSLARAAMTHPKKRDGRIRVRRDFTDNKLLLDEYCGMLKLFQRFEIGAEWEKRVNYRTPERIKSWCASAAIVPLSSLIRHFFFNFINLLSKVQFILSFTIKIFFLNLKFCLKSKFFAK